MIFIYHIRFSSNLNTWLLKLKTYCYIELGKKLWEVWINCMYLFTSHLIISFFLFHLEIRDSSTFTFLCPLFVHKHAVFVHIPVHTHANTLIGLNSILNKSLPWLPFGQNHQNLRSTFNTLFRFSFWVFLFWVLLIATLNTHVFYLVTFS